MLANYTVHTVTKMSVLLWGTQALNLGHRYCRSGVEIAIKFMLMERPLPFYKVSSNSWRQQLQPFLIKVQLLPMPQTAESMSL